MVCAILYRLALTGSGFCSSLHSWLNPSNTSSIAAVVKFYQVKITGNTFIEH